MGLRRRFATELREFVFQNIGTFPPPSFLRGGESPHRFFGFQKGWWWCRWRDGASPTLRDRTPRVRVPRFWNSPPSFLREGNLSIVFWESQKDGGGADGEIRTLTPLRELRPERSASASSATSARNRMEDIPFIASISSDSLPISSGFIYLSP